MKKIFSLLALTAVLVLTFTACSDDDEKLNPNQLPESAVTFLNTYFPGDQIKSVEKDAEHDGAYYDVVLHSGYEVEFDVSGAWVDVDAPAGKTVPSGIVPSAITEYVAENYAQDGINEISKEKYGYKIELLSGVDIKFDNNFVIIGVDK